MPRRPGIVRRRNVNMERRLRTLQRQVAAGQTALAERDQLLSRLYESGYEQRELVDMLNEEMEKAGLKVLTEDAVQKAIRKASAL